MDTCKQQRADLPDKPDHISSFAMEATDAVAATPEELARAVFEGAPRPLQALLTLGWRCVLGLRLAPRGASDHVLGWRLVRSGPGSVTLEAEGALVRARNIFTLGDASLSWTTEVRYLHPLGRALWVVALPVHRLTGPRLLAHSTRDRRCVSVQADD